MGVSPVIFITGCGLKRVSPASGDRLQGIAYLVAIILGFAFFAVVP